MDLWAWVAEQAGPLSSLEQLAEEVLADELLEAWLEAQESGVQAAELIDAVFAKDGAG